jgi:hypothetical protein
MEITAPVAGEVSAQAWNDADLASGATIVTFILFIVGKFIK